MAKPRSPTKIDEFYDETLQQLLDQSETLPPYFQNPSKYRHSLTEIFEVQNFLMTPLNDIFIYFF